MTQNDRELLRSALLEILGTKPQIAFQLEALLWRAKRLLPDLAFSEEDVKAAAKLLEGLKLITITPNPLGALPRFQATASGVLYYERGISSDNSGPVM